MTTYTSAINNSKTDLEGLVKHIRSLLTGGVPLNFSPTSMQVVQRGAGANMSVDVSIGDVHLVRPTGDYSFWGWQDAAFNVVVTTAPASNSRIDAIVAWVDTSVTNVSLNNSPGSLKFSAIVGTVAGSPVAPIDSAIQTALGSTVAWTRLANVTVGTSVTSIVNANISDQRTAIKLRAAVPTAAIEDGAVATAKISDDAVTAAKIDWAATGANAGIWWEELGRVTLGTAGDVLSITSLPPRKYLRILAFATAAGGNINSSVRFNNDSGANYAKAHTFNSGSTAAVDSQANLTGVTLDSTPPSGTSWSLDLTVFNFSTASKSMNGQAVTMGGASSVAPILLDIHAKWVNNAQVSRIDIINSQPGDYAVGSEMIVLGHN